MMHGCCCDERTYTVQTAPANYNLQAMDGTTIKQTLITISVGASYLVDARLNGMDTDFEPLFFCMYQTAIISNLKFQLFIANGLRLGELFERTQ